MGWWRAGAGLNNPFLCLTVHPRPGQDGAQAGETPFPPLSSPRQLAQHWPPGKGAPPNLSLPTALPAFSLGTPEASSRRSSGRARFSQFPNLVSVCDLGMRTQADSPHPTTSPDACARSTFESSLSAPPTSSSVSLHALTIFLKMFLPGSFCIPTPPPISALGSQNRKPSL